MNPNPSTRFRLAVILPAALAILAFAATAQAHCDTLDGPVVIEASKALDSGDITPVLKWIAPDDEAEIRAAFDKTRDVRKLSPEAKALADRWFFETLVRVHRAHEGAPFTGLKPAGAETDPAILAADRALETKSAEALNKTLAGEIEKGLHERFERVIEARAHANDSVEAGRAYVAAYVDFIHYAENIHLAAAREPGEAHSMHAPDAAQAPAAAHAHDPAQAPAPAPGAKPADDHSAHTAPEPAHHD